jgi:CheY-like chemotaxis protein
LATEVRPDLVLMDSELKNEKPGAEAASHIRTQLRLPVVFLATISSIQMVARALDPDPLACINKPFEEAMLKTNIEIALYQHRMEREREDLIGNLQSALAEVKTLSGLIPICAWCKNVRNDQHYWQSVEQYLRSRTSANFSNCICPSCEEKFRRDLARPQAWPDISLPPD